MQRDELLNQLKSQDLATVEPSAFRQVGNPVFPDSSALESLVDFGTVVEAFRHVHLVAYGQPIPATASTASVNNDGDLLALVGNQMALVQAVQVVNTGGDPVDAIALKLNGVVLATFSAAPVGTAEVVVLPFPVYVDSSGPLQVGNSSSAITVKATYVLTSQ